MHSNVPLRAETADAKRQKTRLFWSIYATEKMLALRLGRSSTIRENDITVPRVGHESSPYALLNEMSPIWIAVSDLQGRVYDEIFSPGSLAQPEDVRTARAIALANEAKRLLHAQEEIHVRTTTRQLAAFTTNVANNRENILTRDLMSLGQP